VNDGNGLLFVSHRGDLYPSGFLPLPAGNVRADDLVEVYRNAPLFRALRDPDLLKGKCGACEYRRVCGGSRARAWALTGDALESDPYCVHVPAAMRGPRPGTTDRSASGPPPDRSGANASPSPAERDP
jgi:radical SAM protein with 4Fe4S-binding SPASM domain